MRRGTRSTSALRSLSEQQPIFQHPRGGGGEARQRYVLSGRQFFSVPDSWGTRIAIAIRPRWVEISPSADGGNVPLRAAGAQGGSNLRFPPP